jgi:hypothetical protein
VLYCLLSFFIVVVQYCSYREKSVSGENEGRKSVKFADGVRPGEGTSPSAGEDLPSPPPPPRKHPKEKRFKKRKKMKIKVMVCFKLFAYYWYYPCIL